MRTHGRIFIAWLGLIVAAIPAQALAFQNEPAGFRGIDWGAPIGAVKNQLILISGEGKETYCLRASDKLEIDGAKLKSIVYRFFEGRFFGVALYAERGNRFDFIEAFQRRFGVGEQADPRADKYVWAGANAEIILDCKAIIDDCYAVIRSAEAARQEHADDKGRAGADN